MTLTETAFDALVFAVDGENRCLEKPHPGTLAKRPEVDLGVVGGVVAGDDAGQHARLPHTRARVEEGDVDVGEWLDGQLAQHFDVRATAAHQNQRLLHGNASRCSANTPPSCPAVASQMNGNGGNAASTKPRL